jgi:hypothetical protein
MTLTRIAFACTAALLAAAGAGHAQEPPAATVSGVTVTAPGKLSPAQQVEAFARPDSKGRLARWTTPICPSASGLPTAFNHFIEQRIRTVAQDAGAPVAPPKCQANILILVTPDPAAFTRSIVAQKASALAGGRWPVDKAKLQVFADDHEPVRWLHVSDSVQTLGGAAAAPNQTQMSAGLMSDGDPKGMAATFGRGALAGPPQLGNVFPSRLTPSVEEAFSQVVMVVDARRIAGLSAGQVADYLAMAALAQAQGKTSFAGVDTVLNLFAAGQDEARRPTGLRPWDSAFLAALYRSDSQASYSSQVSHIAQRMSGELDTDTMGSPAR